MKAVEVEDLSTKEFAVKDGESEIKLGGGDSQRETNQHQRQDAVDC
jgi:hypothetical protein